MFIILIWIISLLWGYRSIRMRISCINRGDIRVFYVCVTMVDDPPYNPAWSANDGHGTEMRDLALIIFLIYCTAIFLKFFYEHEFNYFHKVQCRDKWVTKYKHPWERRINSKQNWIKYRYGLWLIIIATGYITLSLILFI